MSQPHHEVAFAALSDGKSKLIEAQQFVGVGRKHTGTRYLVPFCEFDYTGPAVYEIYEEKSSTKCIKYVGYTGQLRNRMVQHASAGDTVTPYNEEKLELKDIRQAKDWIRHHIVVQKDVNEYWVRWVRCDNAQLAREAEHMLLRNFLYPWNNQEQPTYKETLMREAEKVCRITEKQAKQAKQAKERQAQQANAKRLADDNGDGGTPKMQKLDNNDGPVMV